MPNKTGIPIITKERFGPIGVELRVIRSSGNPIDIQSGHSLFADAVMCCIQDSLKWKEQRDKCQIQGLTLE